MAEKKTAAAPVNSLEAVIAQIRKEFGADAIQRLDEAAAKPIPVVSTGSYSLDFALGVGGLPRGRIVEIYGAESSGKTTLSLHVIANAQQEGGVAAFIDTEHALDINYAEKLGVRKDRLLVSQPNSGEEALSIAEALVKSGGVDVVVLDSVAALTPRAEIDGEMGDSHVGLQARLMSQAMRKLTACIATTNTLCIFTNQIREKIGVMFGNPETTTGGRALKFYASVRLQVQRIGQLKDSASGQVVGNRTRVKVVKNKVAAPFAEAEFDIVYAKGINWEGSLLEAAIEKNVVQKRGSWIAFGDSQLGQGVTAAADFITTHPEVAAQIIEKMGELNPAARNVKPRIVAAEPPIPADAEVPAEK